MSDQKTYARCQRQIYTESEPAELPVCGRPAPKWLALCDDDDGFSICSGCAAKWSAEGGELQPSDPAERMARYDNEGKILPEHTPGAQRAALALFESGFVASNGPDVVDQLARIIDATTAAPDLLAAAEALYDSVGRSGWNHATPKPSERARRDALLNKIRAAIERALGEDSQGE